MQAENGGKDVESIIIRCVDSSRKQEGGSYPKPRKSDMLDLASERAGEDKRFTMTRETVTKNEFGRIETKELDVRSEASFIIIIKRG